MAAHRYWRINITATDSGTSASIAEIQLRNTLGGSNLIGSGTAAASSTLGGSAASNASDGNAATSWSTVAATSPPWWWSYDFGVGNSFDIIEVLITSVSSGNANVTPKAFEVQYSDNNTTWTTYWVGLATTWSNSQTQTFDIPATGTAYVTQNTMEVLVTGGSPVRVSQSVLEVMVQGNSTANVSQSVLEVAATGGGLVKMSNAVMEVLITSDVATIKSGQVFILT